MPAMGLNKFVKIIFITSIFISSINCINKYSKEANEEYPDSDVKPFRMQKINLVWDKAVKKLSGQKLKDLRMDLRKQDKDEISLKRAKSEGQDKDGLLEASVRKSFKNILFKYHLDNLVDDEFHLVNNPNANSDEKHLFRDKKLEKLWSKVEKFNLPEVKLKLLKEELEHHQDRIDEFHKLAELVEEKKVKFNNIIDNHGNSIDMLDTIDEHRKSLNEHEKSLKEKHKELKMHYNQIKNKLNEHEKTDEFDEQTAQLLWEEAKKANFSVEELNSLKDELHHYEKRLKKLNYFEEELRLKEEFDGKMKKKFKEDDLSEYQQHPLKEKVKDLSRKADKLERSIKEKIKKKHSEL